ncbi:MAG: amidohydrolase [Gammaproteobacteria bacterium]|nr:amidohydrolase [Gammaproteobacteria bacterium]
MKRLVGTLSLCLAFLSAPLALAETLSESIAADYDARLGDLFAHFHAHPELSGVEFETARRMADELRELGYEVTEGVGGTGVVAVLENGAGPTVMLRADMDGLPLQEDTGLAYASTVRQKKPDGKEFPVMHACGHDVHITSLVGTARQMVQRKDQWSGTLVLVVQPAEETISGAAAMLRDGLYQRFPKPEYALAFHVDADSEAGKINVPLNAVASSSDSVDIIVHGVGAHGAYPQQGIDPVLVAAQIVVSLQSIVSRSISPLEPGVITVGAIHGGTKHNIIGARVEMQLTVRSDSFETRKKLLAGIKRVAEGVAISLGVPGNLMPEVIFSSTETTPPTLNDEATARLIRTTLEAHFAPGTLVENPRTGMGAEDFAYFVDPELGVKGVYFDVGGTPAEEVGSAPSHHSPFFKIQPEPAVRAGVEAMVVSAMALMPPAE